ncbi:MmgE/PrpD family protein [Celeribacter naphthalenivorans]|uniref:MmgE/PrpD family protein n=1 Tax=Celeribacter naphthalenivorans TaxID=1614694 RepID=UPI001CFBD6C3|nr:MmgE/PrpD family protein [Celeribacter naphthalenivorans]
MTSSPQEAGFALEEAVAEFVVNFQYKDIDTGSMPAVKAILKDQLALQVGAVDLPWSIEARNFLDAPRPGKASVVTEHTTIAPADAAYINATYGHGFEYDDVASNGHPGCCVVPTALAVGEEVGATIGETIEAMVAGYEVFVRVGRLAAPDLVNNGWHAHAVLANFGAAAVAAKLYKLPKDKVVHALAIALSHASGTTEYTKSGGSIKRVHAGIAVRNGIESVKLAMAGITGPKKFLTGPKGFFRNFIKRDAVEADAKLAFAAGEPLRVSGTWLKPYCCCGAHHPYIDAMAARSGRVAEIEAVTARVQAMTRTLADNPQAQQNGTTNIEELQFSLALEMGLAALGKGNGYATHRAFLDGNLDIGPTSDVVDFARRITVEHAPDLDAAYPFNFVGDLRITYGDGTVEEVFMDGAKGMPNHPFTDAEHREKLNELTFGVLGEAQATALFDLIEAFDPSAPVTALTDLVKPSA